MAAKKLEDVGVHSVKEQEEEFQGRAVALLNPHVGQECEYGLSVRSC